MSDLFSQALADDLEATGPLADRLRPRQFSDFVGQEPIINSNSPLRQAIDRDQLFSFLLWGPPGTGKTTLARLIAEQTKARFVALSGVTSGKQDVVASVEQAVEQRKLHGHRTILFVDEIHRWSKTQQDALLPYVEQGIVTLIGATTENPSFEVIPALLSRTKTFVLTPLTIPQLVDILRRALTDTKRGYGHQVIDCDQQTLEYIAAVAQGDARSALSTLELVVQSTPKDAGKIVITSERVSECIQHAPVRYDRQGDEHYQVISAFIKSMRGSDPDAAIYWLARMIEAGEDPLFIARRMVIFASEDISLADPHALSLAMACRQACEVIGMPECRITLAHVVVYLATCPKSNESYEALNAAMDEVKRSRYQPVPLHLRNAPTEMMKDFGYGRDYAYTHDHPDTEQQFLPDILQGKIFYHPKHNPFRS